MAGFSVGQQIRSVLMCKFSASVCAVATLAAMLTSCSTPPTPDGQVASAYAVGDHTRVLLEEVIVSLPLRGTPEPYQNLHVGLAATVNPVRSTPYSAYKVAGIVQRLEARIGGRLVEILTGLEQQSVEDRTALRSLVAREAQAVVDEAMQQWQHGAEYDVKMVVVSLYWTDSSVGRAPSARRWW
jgi:hypothetical protein